jgi:hypothetical protein
VALPSMTKSAYAKRTTTTARAAWRIIRLVRTAANAAVSKLPVPQKLAGHVRYTIASVLSCIADGISAITR